MDATGGYQTHKFIPEFYDFVPAYCQGEDTALYIEELKPIGSPVLELGCGTGRVLLPLARAGLQVTGIDLAEPMLGLCRHKLAQETQDIRERVELYNADMRQFQLNRMYRSALIPLRSFGHLLTVDDQLSCLRCINQHLVDGGILMMDLHQDRLMGAADEVESIAEGEDPPFAMTGGRVVVRKAMKETRDVFDQIQQWQFTFVVTYDDGHSEQFVHSFPMRYLFRFEAEHLLARCGFEIENLWADYDRTPYRSVMPGALIIRARKVCPVD